MLRRNFLIGLGAMLFAPAIVRAESIMPVRAIVIPHSALWMKIVGTDGCVDYLDKVHPSDVAKILDAQLVYFK